MAEVFNWVRPGYELVEIKLEWNVQVPFLQTTDGNGERIISDSFSSKETSCNKWQLGLHDARKKLAIIAWHEGENASIVEPVLANISILNGKRGKIFQQMRPSMLNKNFIPFLVNKRDILKSKCQQADGSLTFYFKLISHVEKENTVSSAKPPGFAMDCSGGLISHLEGLFYEMQFSDVSFNIGHREFPAHKNILAARSEVFAAMFQHPTKENLTNQITIKDIEPEVFQEFLRFIYTGRVPLDKMETMAAGLLIAADKYLLGELKMECENYLLHQMSPANCVELILYGDMFNPAGYFREAAKFFRRLPSEVMATEKWEKMEEEDPKKLFHIQKILFSNK